MTRGQPFRALVGRDEVDVGGPRDGRESNASPPPAGPARPYFCVVHENIAISMATAGSQATRGLPGP